MVMVTVKIKNAKGISGESICSAVDADQRVEAGTRECIRLLMLGYSRVYICSNTPDYRYCWARGEFGSLDQTINIGKIIL